MACDLKKEKLSLAVYCTTLRFVVSVLVFLVVLSTFSHTQALSTLPESVVLPHTSKAAGTAKHRERSY